MITDATLFVHGTGTVAFGALSVTAGVYGDSCCSSASQYSNLELDFGAPGSAGSYPYVSQFPSLTEKGYTNAPECSQRLDTAGCEKGDGKGYCRCRFLPGPGGSCKRRDSSRRWRRTGSSLVDASDCHSGRSPAGYL